MATQLQVIVPTADNDGRTLQPEIDQWEGYLLDTLGGYTREPVTGAWRDDSGRVYHDQSYRYTLSGTRVADVRASLAAWCETFRQEALYASTSAVKVSFVVPAQVTAHA